MPSLLSFFGKGQPGSWVACGTVDDPKAPPVEPRAAVDAERYPGLTAAHVPLVEHEVDVFYKRFSKEAFLTVIDGFWERARFSEDDWALFKRVNRRFAEATAAEAWLSTSVWSRGCDVWMVRYGCCASCGRT